MIFPRLTNPSYDGQIALSWCSYHDGETIISSMNLYAICTVPDRTILYRITLHRITLHHVILGGVGVGVGVGSGWDASCLLYNLRPEEGAQKKASVLQANKAQLGGNLSCMSAGQCILNTI